MLKRRNRIALLLFCIVLLTACHSPDASKTKLLRLAHGLPVEHPVHRGMAYFAEKVSEYSNRQIEIKIYPGGQLGGERECIESLQIGSLDMTKVNSHNCLPGCRSAQSHDHLWYDAGHGHGDRSCERATSRSLMHCCEKCRQNCC